MVRPRSAAAFSSWPRRWSSGSEASPGPDPARAPAPAPSPPLPVPAGRRLRPPREPRRRRFRGRPSGPSAGARSPPSSFAPPSASSVGRDPSPSPLRSGATGSAAVADPEGPAGVVVVVAGSGSARGAASAAEWSSGSEAGPASAIVSSDIDSFSHDARASTARRGSAASGSSRAPPRSIHCPVRRTRRSASSPPERGEQLAGPDAHRLRRHLDLEADTVLGCSRAHRSAGVPGGCPPLSRGPCACGVTQHGRCCHRRGRDPRHDERCRRVDHRAPSPRSATRPRSPLPATREPGRRARRPR